jgi:CubicO group peptidase (beta-lactamase class C family)
MVAGFQAAAEYSERMGGTAVLVATVDEILFEDYHNGADASTATHIHSATKAFWAAAAAAALEDGLLESFDERVALTIDEWMDADAHPGKSLIELDHLLTLSSGLSQDVDQIQGHETGAADIYDYVTRSLRLIRLPGAWFQYGPSHYYAFGVYLERKLEAAGQAINPLEYLEERVLGPIGLVYEDWVHDEAGNPHIPNGCTIRPQEWIKYGQFLLAGGSWKGEQIVDASILGEMLLATGPNPGHGRFLWLNRHGGHGVTPLQMSEEDSLGGFIYRDGHPDLYAAMGAGRNRMYIIPSLGVVALRQTLGDTGQFDDHAFLSLLLSGCG